MVALRGAHRRSLRRLGAHDRLSARMAQLFPNARNEREFAPFRTDELALAGGVRAICDQLALGGVIATRFPEGTQPVYAIGLEHVLKIYPPFARQHCETEAAVLEAIDGRLPIPTPALRAVGELGGWSYVLMQRLAGESLARAWPSIPSEDQLRLAEVLGESLARLHAVPAPELPAVRIDWSTFIADQRQTCVERQRRHGLSEHWLEQIPAFLAATPLADAAPGALLHTEVMREHLLVNQGPNGWQLSGLFDFEPAMQGAPEYEFGALGDGTVTAATALGSSFATTRQAFSPWGGRLPLSAGSQSSSIDKVTVGFTDQEQDDGVGLVNMRGRVYDSVTRTFLTTDPIVGSPLKVSGWNKYSYVLNNPLKYIDPSGFADVVITTGLGNTTTVDIDMKIVVPSVSQEPTTPEGFDPEQCSDSG